MLHQRKADLIVTSFERQLAQRLQSDGQLVRNFWDYLPEGHRRLQLKWFVLLDHRNLEDRVSACRKVEVAGARCKGMKRKNWKECVDKDMNVLGFLPQWAVFGDVWRDFI